MNAADLVDARSIARDVEVATGTVGVQRLGRIQPRGEQPILGPRMATAQPPVQPQLLEQFGRQQAVAVVPTLARDDADAHAIGR